MCPLTPPPQAPPPSLSSSCPCYCHTSGFIVTFGVLGSSWCPHEQPTPPTPPTTPPHPTNNPPLTAVWQADDPQSSRRSAVAGGGADCKHTLSRGGAPNLLQTGAYICVSAPEGGGMGALLRVVNHPLTLLSVWDGNFSCAGKYIEYLG